ncbi:hypothetical protein COU00_01000 [Candidatus Falkowbacteria bacterium CG10_big_fil_rev_8_21_14_0_10_43_11]|uniref:PDZ domain-containing protein n=1 Tax=Candidatus Falkowbacteria bacterium CG10_big_fil_rev_8_21_14_0_10_43_11 TaxID=1974568 RepID=A0A2M6WMN5_9BACT|nr:MAG: hypothetical protein COU00_01000 [Candidatus Falkowbacteria bacterium CG10_big_fil_rev_8_21_14_0_10_43_11]
MIKKNLFLFIAIIFLSLLGGIAGGVVVHSYLLSSSFNIPPLGDINLGGRYQNGNVIISQPRKVVVEQDDRLASVINEAQKNVINFYIKKSDSSANNKSALDVKSFYFPYERVGQGLALTNDGWILTSAKVSQPANFIAVDYEGNIMPLESAVENKDGSYFVKVTAKNLRAVRFADKNSLTRGQLLAVLHNNDVRVVYAENTNSAANPAAVRSSEGWSRMVKINNSALITGEVAFNLDGFAVGLYAGDGLVMPIDYYTQFLPALLNKKEFTRPYLGVNYLNLSAVISERKLTGALVTADSKGIAVIRNSPAAQAGIKYGDIIAEVDGIKVGADNSLNELIQSHQPGEEIELTILRGENKENIKVKLGSVK